MHPEAIFLTGYALALVAVAAGLEAVGRRSADPQVSPLLAARRRTDPGPLDADPSPPLPSPDRTSDGRRSIASIAWLDADVPRLHRGLAVVAVAAALVLTSASTVRHHRPAELVVQLVVLALITASTARLLGRLRTGSSQ